MELIESVAWIDHGILGSKWPDDTWPTLGDMIAGRVDYENWPTRDAACPEEEC